MNIQTNSNMIIYNDGELELNVSVENETIWLTQKQIAELFSVEVHTINYHIKNIFKQKELNKNPTIRKIRVVQKEGNREVERDVDHYNLDMIISIGYRVNSITATKFRQWATSVLKSYIQNGYVVNSEKITHERFKELESDVLLLKSQVANISKQLNLDFQKYRAQYKNIELQEFKKAHDRFLIIDNLEIYHIGASLKDLGKKWFAFSKFEMEALEILGRLK